MRSRQSSRSSAKTGQEMAVCGPMESRWVRIAPVPCAKAQRSAKSMRARTSCADQFAVAVRGGVVERAHEGAVWVRRARPDMALVEMGVDVDEARQHDAAVEIEARAGRASRLNVPAGVTEAMRPSSIVMSIAREALPRRAASPALVTRAERRARVREAIARRVGNARRSPGPCSPLLRQGALVPAPQGGGGRARTVARKITTPVAARSPSAAKRRGMLRRYWLSTMR